jgi:uncharacterized membrane protein YdbT with pleckstrin-like domain
MIWEASMADIVVRPTMKFIKAGYAGVILLIVGVATVWYMFHPDPMWVPAVLLILLIWPLSHHIRRQSTKVTISGDKLRYELGLLGKTTRTIQLSKIQDVRVDQSLMQRIFGVGSISIETAGEASRLTVRDIDLPQAIADEIMARAQHGPDGVAQLSRPL